MSGAAKKGQTGVLSVPSQFEKTTKHNLIPPSSFASPLVTDRNKVIKTPSDFTIKDNAVHCEEATDKRQPPPQHTPNFNEEKYQEISTHAEVNLINESVIPQADINSTNVPLFVGDSEQCKESATDMKGGHSEFPYLLSIPDESVSREAYVKLQQMYTESKTKLDDLELRICEMSEVYSKQNNPPENKEVLKEEKLTEKMEHLKLQNELLQNQLQKSGCDNFFNVRDIVDRYLTQSQIDSEKNALNKKVADLENRVHEMEIEKEKLLKNIEMQKEKFHQIIVQNEEECYSYKECIVKLNERISIMSNQNGELKKERDEYLKMKQDLNLKIAEFNQIVDSKNKDIDDLMLKTNKEINKNNDLGEKMEKQRGSFESALSNIEKLLREEVIRSSNLCGAIQERDDCIKQLENNLNEMQQFIKELQSDSNKVSSFEKNFARQSEEIAHLRSSCHMLQSSNEILNIRVASLNEILKMQQPYTKGSLGDEKYNKILKMWREKVYSLLVLLKVKELNNPRDELYSDGFSTL